MNLEEMGGAAEWAQMGESGRMHWLQPRKQLEMRRIGSALSVSPLYLAPPTSEAKAIRLIKGGRSPARPAWDRTRPISVAYYGSSIALWPASVICTRMISIARPPTFTVSPCCSQARCGQDLPASRLGSRPQSTFQWCCRANLHLPAFRGLGVAPC